jgi:hypothetical protein
MGTRANVPAVREEPVEGIRRVVVEPDQAASREDLREAWKLHGREPSGDRFAAETIDSDRNQGLAFEPEEGDRVAGDDPSRDGKEALVPLAVHEVGREVQRNVDEWFEHVVMSIPCARKQSWGALSRVV